MGSLNYRRILALVGVFSLMCYYALYWVNLINDPDERTGSDFIGFYNFGRIMQEKGIQAIYDIKEIHPVDDVIEHQGQNSNEGENTAIVQISHIFSAIIYYLRS